MKQYIVECPCGVVTRSFWDSKEAAIKKLDELHQFGCGHNCNDFFHKLIEIEMETPEKEGEVFWEDDKGFHSELVKVMK